MGSLVQSDVKPFFSDAEREEFEKAIFGEYVFHRDLNLSEDEFARMSITDGAEMWRMYTGLYDVTSAMYGESEYSQEKIDRLSSILAQKVRNTDYLYCLYSKKTGEPYLFSATIRQEDEKQYIFTIPHIRIFTEATAGYEAQKYPDDIEMRRIDRGADGRGIENFLGEAFYLNGAMEVEIQNKTAVIPAGKILAPPNFSGMDPAKIPVMNPNLMRWMLMMAQMPTAVTEEEKSIYMSYYRFMAQELVEARFLVPIKEEEDFQQPPKGEEKKAKQSRKFRLAMLEGKQDRAAVAMYTDRRRVNKCYDGWNSVSMTIKEIIHSFDVVINWTDYNALGFYIGEDSYERFIKKL